MVASLGSMPRSFINVANAASSFPSSFREKLRDELDGRLGIFFHDPVPGIWNNAAGDIGGDEAQIIRHCRAEGFLRADGEHRHRDLAALGEQRLVVNGVLAECAELL